LKITEYTVKIRFPTRHEAEEIREMIVECFQVIPDKVERQVVERDY
jgi:hypothetical protein